MKSLICIAWLFFSFTAKGQTEHYTSDYNDSVLSLLIKNVPKSKREGFKEFFNGMTDEQRSLFYAMSLPVSSKKDLIKNIDTNYSNIQQVIILFKELIPSEMRVYIEFHPPQKLLKLGESIDIWSSRNTKSGDKTPLFQKWNVELSSKELDSLLVQINMNRNKLEKLHAALIKAHCISIENANPVKIGFARSGMGKYNYMILDHHLSDPEMKYYNNGCEYIYYKDNIVLEYSIGAVGSPCFPYEEPE